MIIYRKKLTYLTVIFWCLLHSTDVNILQHPQQTPAWLPIIYTELNLCHCYCLIGVSGLVLANVKSQPWYSVHHCICKCASQLTLLGDHCPHRMHTLCGLCSQNTLPQSPASKVLFSGLLNAVIIYRKGWNATIAFGGWVLLNNFSFNFTKILSWNRFSLKSSQVKVRKGITQIRLKEIHYE